MSDSSIIDIHSHIFPKIDDGSRSMEMSLEMLAEARRQGVTAVFLTPHCYYLDGISKEYLNSIVEKLQEKSGMRLYLGSEVLCSADNIYDVIRNLKAGTYPTMNGTKYVLTEFYLHNTYDNMKYMLSQIKKAGYKPIIAHCERYAEFVGIEQVRDMKKEDYLIQVNAFSLGEEKNTKIHDLAMKILENGFMDFVGSDAHRTEHRNVAVKVGVDVIKKCDGWEDILYANAKGLLCFV